MVSLLGVVRERRDRHGVGIGDNAGDFDVPQRQDARSGWLLAGIVDVRSLHWRVACHKPDHNSVC
ncbi:MAG: hypothetical protein ACRCUE_11200 [Bosea sp. (in: a-proteobacteria)]